MSEQCWCRRCEEARGETFELQPGWTMPVSRFIVCPICGNKRCPRASSHENACTASNEAGQPGSDYA